MGLLYLLTRSHFRQQTSGTLLELTILGRVYERVDDAVAVHEHGTQVVVPASDERVDDAVAVHEHGAQVVVPAPEVDIVSDEGGGD